MRPGFAVLLAGHGIAHLVGFIGALNLGPDIHVAPTILGGAVTLGATALRVYAGGWLVAAIAYQVVSLLFVVGSTRWRGAAVAVTCASLVLCLLGYPVSQVGILVDVVLLAVVLRWDRLLSSRLRA